MSRSTLAKVGLIALLFAIVLMTRPADRDWFTVAILIFGIVNVLLDPPGTLAIRGLQTIDAQGGTSTFFFTNLKENVGIADKEFAFKIPRGVDVISAPSRP